MGSSTRTIDVNGHGTSNDVFQDNGLNDGNDSTSHKSKSSCKCWS